MAKARLVWIVFPVLLVTVPLLAATPEPAASAAPARVNVELLEFLGTWQGSDGRWVDPMMFAGTSPVELVALRVHGGAPVTGNTQSHSGRGPLGDSSRHS